MVDERYENFTDDVIGMLVRAHRQAKLCGQSVVGSEFLLLVLVADKSSFGSKALKKMGIRLRDVRREISIVVPRLDKRYKEEEEIPFSRHFKNVVQRGYQQMEDLAHENLAPDHLLFSLLQEESCIGRFVLTQLGADVYALQRELTEFLESDECRFLVAGLFQGYLSALGTDITQNVFDGLVDPVIGRDSETLDTILVLSRRRKSNPCLVGEAGVGKTAVAEGLAQRIISGDVPEGLQGCLVVSIDIGVLVAGTRFRGVFETRMKGIIDECKEIKNIIILIDEIHSIVGSGAAEGAADAANLLKPSLARGDFKCLGATTLAEYKKYIEKDAALERRFQPVFVLEPSIEETVEILWGLRPIYEKYYRVTITFVALFSAANLGKQFLGDRYLPDKAIDLLDEAGSRYNVAKAGLPESARVFDRELTEVLKLKNRAIRDKDFEGAQECKDQENDLRIRRHAQWVTNRKRGVKKPTLRKNILTEVDIGAVVAEWIGIPADQISENELDRLKKMKNMLRSKIIGQPSAINAVTRALRRSRVGIQDSNRPIAALLFAGPTGTGKTELTKVVAHFFFGKKDRLLRFDMSEYMEEYSVSKLIGSPPGYAGHKEGGRLTEAVRRQPNSLVLFDELEKAHRKIYTIMLQIFDEGYITSSKGNLVSFKSSMVVVTSNAGAYAVCNYCVANKAPRPKFREAFRAHYETLRDIVKLELSKTFRPEFLNRLDEVVVFQTLQERAIKKITNLMLDKIGKRVRKYEISLQFQPGFLDFISDQGFDPAFGARPLRRAMTKLVEDPIADYLLLGIREGLLVWDVTPDGRKYTVIPYLEAQPPTGYKAVPATHW